MEVGIDAKVATYSGGLGILAGDTLKTSADMALPYVGVTLLTRKGYFRQGINTKGCQVERPQVWPVDKQLKKCKPTITLHLDGQPFKVRAWCYEARGLTGHVVPVYYLDTDIAGNPAELRTLSHHLYGGDNRYRLMQEWVLGAGGVKMLRALGYRDISCFHMNEGHAAFLTFELMAEQLKRQKRARPAKSDVEALTRQCVFTTHTPVPAGHDCFDLKEAKALIGDHPMWKAAGRFIQNKTQLNMTHLALAFSRFVNGVAKKHAEVSRAMFPNHQIEAVTNGIHVPTWIAPPIAKLLDAYVTDWKLENDHLRHALALPLKELDRAHQVSKDKLIALINKKSPVRFKRNAFTIGFARRATPYKRADLIFKDIERLKQIAGKVGAFQLVFAGKAHPKDEGGKQLIQAIHNAAQQLGRDIPTVYLPNYEIKLAQCLIPGVDIWLNNPEPPMEASGTSGMKAALNGVPNLSVLDGWWIEGCIEGLTGWSIGDPAKSSRAADARALYKKLEKVIDLYYENHEAFVHVMRNAIALNGSYFSTQRMLREYCL
ncbi:MAG: alpha-glucan family phosphorylase, partial [Planctomycetes bacterium]|nr:alpha-glucan family phosphorylase [Planctomycetota bacterium]